MAIESDSLSLVTQPSRARLTTTRGENRENGAVGRHIRRLLDSRSQYRISTDSRVASNMEICRISSGSRRYRPFPSLNGNFNWRGSLQVQWRLRCRSYRSALAPRSMSCFIGEATALGPGQRNRGAGNIIHAKFFASVVSEIELGQITMQVGSVLRAIRSAQPSG